MPTAERRGTAVDATDPAPAGPLRGCGSSPHGHLEAARMSRSPSHAAWRRNGCRHPPGATRRSSSRRAPNAGHMLDPAHARDPLARHGSASGGSNPRGRRPGPWRPWGPDPVAAGRSASGPVATTRAEPKATGRHSWPMAARSGLDRPARGSGVQDLGGMRRTQPGWIRSGSFTGGVLASTISVYFAPWPLP